MRNRGFPAVLVNKHVTIIKAIPALHCVILSPKGTQEGEEYLLSPSHQTAATPCGEPQEAQDGKKPGYLPRRAEMHLKGMISVSPALASSTALKKMQNSTTWDIWFSLITNNTFMFRLPALCCKTSI